MFTTAMEQTSFNLLLSILRVFALIRGLSLIVGLFGRGKESPKELSLFIFSFVLGKNIILKKNYHLLVFFKNRSFYCFFFSEERGINRAKRLFCLFRIFLTWWGFFIHLKTPTGLLQCLKESKYLFFHF